MSGGSEYLSQSRSSSSYSDADVGGTMELRCYPPTLARLEAAVDMLYDDVKHRH